MTGTKVKNQLGLEDVVVRDAELEQLLEDREAAKEEAKAYREIDKKAKAHIENMEQKPPFRVGRFVITKSTVEGRHVDFDTETSSRIGIKLLGE